MEHNKQRNENHQEFRKEERLLYHELCKLCHADTIRGKDADGRTKKMKELQAIIDYVKGLQAVATRQGNPV